MREERHTGRVGDAYLIVEMTKYHRAQGSRDGDVAYQPKDVLLRVRHTGDCFSDYFVFRHGHKIGTWSGYDAQSLTEPTYRLGNVVEDMIDLPYKQKGLGE